MRRFGMAFFALVTFGGCSNKTKTDFTGLVEFGGCRELMVPLEQKGLQAVRCNHLYHVVRTEETNDGTVLICGCDRDKALSPEDVQFANACALAKWERYKEDM